MEIYELGGLPPTPVIRKDTLESQRNRGATRKWQRLKFWRSTEATELDATASLIAAATKKHAVGSSFIKDFRYLYRRPDKTLLDNLGLSMSYPPVVTLPEREYLTPYLS